MWPRAIGLINKGNSTKPKVPGPSKVGHEYREMNKEEIWKKIEDQMRPDGALRDIYILDTNIEDWERVFSFLKVSKYDHRFGVGDKEIEINRINWVQQLEGS